MQAIIMAAGKGSRLGNITNKKPKTFLSIKGHNIIEYNLAMLHKYGIWDINIVVGYQADIFFEFLKEIPGISLIYNPFYEFTNVLGSYYMGMGRLHDDTIYMHADTLCDTDIFENLLVADGDVVLPIDGTECDDEAMKVRMQDNRVTEIAKDMNNEDAAGEFIGICKIARKVLPELNEATTELLREKKYSSYFEAALQRVLDEEKFEFAVFNAEGRFWREIDFMEDYEDAVENISDNILQLLA